MHVPIKIDFISILKLNKSFLYIWIEKNFNRISRELRKLWTMRAERNFKYILYKTEQLIFLECRQLHIESFWSISITKIRLHFFKRLLHKHKGIESLPQTQTF